MQAHLSQSESIIAMRTPTVKLRIPLSIPVDFASRDGRRLRVAESLTGTLQFPPLGLNEWQTLTRRDQP